MGLWIKKKVKHNKGDGPDFVYVQKINLNVNIQNDVGYRAAI